MLSLEPQPLPADADFSPPLADDLALEWGAEGAREPVDVDHRALVDKILARYSSSTKFSVLRELLQNADDAEAKHAFIRFESKSFVNGDGQALDLDFPIHRWTIHNDGKIFSFNDWDRMKRIADGNPDEHKIGTFGVGFYSVFSVTDSPTIKSGVHKMRFHWSGKQDKQLFVSRSRLSPTSSTASKWTSFELPARTPSQMPGSVTEIGRFLTASLPFMANLEVVTVALDSYILLRLHKYSQAPTSVALIKHLNPKIQGGLMTVSKLAKTKITVEVKAYTYSALGNNDIPTPPYTPKISSSSKTMHVLRAKVAVSLDAEGERGLAKVTKKNVHKDCLFQMVYAANVEQNEVGDSWFAPLNTNVQGTDAYVHIGHATTQTTGFAGQIAAPFILTVERELIDFEKSHVKDWNEGLLGVGGYVARTIYEYEMLLPEEEQANWDVHPLRFFAYRESTPHACVSKIMTESFFTCSDRSLSVFSSLGLRPAAEVRDYDPDVSFITKVPMLTPLVVEEAPEMIGLLKERGVVMSASLDDLKLELSDDRVFTESEMVSCLKWLLKTGTITEENAKSFLDIARFQHSLNSREVELRQIRTILIPGGPEFPQFIPPGDYLPDHTLPYEVSKEFQVDQLMQLMLLFGWKKLTVIEWLEDLTSLLSPAESGSIAGSKFAELCFDVLALAWSDLKEADKERIKDLLKDLECIPTQKGMKRPKEAYLWGCSFMDLPTVTIVERSVVRSILEFLELTPRVEFLILLDAAEKGEDALRYFIDNFGHYRSDYEDETNRELVSGKAIIPAVNISGGQKMVTVSEAFMETSCQKMGFWIVDERFRGDIAIFGIHNSPQPSQLISRLKSEPPVSRPTAIQYFEYLFSRNDFTEENYAELSSLSFVPTSTVDPASETGKPRMVSPKDCYLGQPRSELYSKLFDFVDFANYGNIFLGRCKAKQEPTTDDIALALATDPVKFFDYAGGKDGLSEYMRELNVLAQNRKEISKETMEKLKTTSAFIGFPYKCFEAAHSNYEETLQLASGLLRADQIVIVDDSRNYTVFRNVENLFHVPKVLETFYGELGSPALSKLIDETYIPEGDEVIHPQRSEEIRELLLQCLSLFVTENPEHKQRLEHVTKDGNFSVRVFKTLKVKKVLEFGSDSQNEICDGVSAGFRSDNGVFELFLANESLDYFEMAYCLLKVFYETPSTHVCLLLSTLLSSSLSSLRQGGYLADTDMSKSTTRPLSTIDFSDLSEMLKKVDFQGPSSRILRFVLPKNFLKKSNTVPWGQFEEELEKALDATKGSPESSTFVSIRKERSKQCVGSKYRGTIYDTEKKCGPYNVYVGEGVTIEDVKNKKSCIECFVNNVVDPLRAQVFCCAPETIRVLYDPNSRDLAAFNREGKVFLNLADFEKTCYVDGTVSDIAAALVFWYFTLAHEITHNFVSSHNSLFERCYTRICHKFLMQLFQLEPLSQA